MLDEERLLLTHHRAIVGHWGAAPHSRFLACSKTLLCLDFGSWRVFQSH
jgi:hypothetical protein